MSEPTKTKKKSFTIHDLPVSERPRERLLNLGSEALSAQEILALVLGRGIAGESVMVTAQRLLSGFGNFKGIANASGGTDVYTKSLNQTGVKDKKDGYKIKPI